MKSVAEEFVKFCPDCGSAQIFLDPVLKNAYRDFRYRCKDCGLRAKTFPEVALKDLKKVQAELNFGSRESKLEKAEKKQIKKNAGKKRPVNAGSVKKN